MNINRIKVHNYKTYQDLDLDLSVATDRPIVLIGGANGGGKTTLFEAITGALYGLPLKTAKDFQARYNWGKPKDKQPKIELEIHFEGMVLNRNKQFVLKRTYLLTEDNRITENVDLNMEGSRFSYGTHTPLADRRRSKAEVDKIINANLPEALSEYFLFDAMKSGEKLEEDRLNQVIKDNFLNVMGFRRYVQLAQAAEQVHQQLAAQRISAKSVRERYLELSAEINRLKEQRVKLEENHTQLLEWIKLFRPAYQQAREGVESQSNLLEEIDRDGQELQLIAQKDEHYHKQADEFFKQASDQVGMPRLGVAFADEIAVVAAHFARAQQQQSGGAFSRAQLQQVVQWVKQYFDLLGDGAALPDGEALFQYLAKQLELTDDNNPYAYLNADEVAALTQLMDLRVMNQFPRLMREKAELQLSLHRRHTLQERIRLNEAQLKGQQTTIIAEFEAKDKETREQKQRMEAIDQQINTINNELHEIDVPATDEPDPKFEMSKRLKPFLDQLGAHLLRRKKDFVENKLLDELNRNLVAHKNVIARVELSDNLEDFSLRLFHIAGTEIYLSQLNTASKQILVQVLLKVLHSAGDYTPPVMIDTVMGVLDKQHRAVMLEHYFPTLAQQTILLSSNSEIEPDEDLEKLEAYISKTYTLQRDSVAQSTRIVPGYFTA